MKIFKIVVFNIILMITDALALSKLIFDKNNSHFEIALFSTLLFISVPIFFYYNFNKIIKDRISYTMDQLDEDDEFIFVLNEFANTKCFSEIVDTLKIQIKKRQDKSQSINKLIRQNFNDDASGFVSVNKILEESKSIIYQNSRDIINIMTIFDDKASNNSNSILDNNIKKEKKDIWIVQFDVIKKLINSNEVILLEIDKLMVEMTKISGRKCNENEINNIKDIIKSLTEIQGKTYEELEMDKLVETYKDK